MRWLAGVVWGIAAFAQAPDSPTIRVDVRQVLVPVIVTDAKGHHATGLKASDFRILEDGVEQEVAAFSTDAAPSAAAMVAGVDGAGRGAASAAARTFVIAIDALHTAPANSARTREALARLFEKDKPAGAQYVVLSIGRQLQVIQTATSDPATVAAKLRNPAAAPAMGGGDAMALRSELDDLKKRMYDFCRRCAACGSRSDYRACDAETQTLKLSVDAQAERWGIQTRGFLAQLKAVVDELAKLPTGRTLILVSDGFSLQPTREFYAVVASFLPADPRFKMTGPSDLEPELQAVLKVAAERNVRIYAVDSRGLAQGSFAGSGPMDASAPQDNSAPSVIRHTPSTNRGGTLLSDMDHEAASVAFQNGGGMDELARATGGVYYHDGNDMLKQFRSVLADGREYYLLAYVSKNRTQDGKFRAVTVEVTDKKLRVRAKSGYWAATEP